MLTREEEDELNGLFLAAMKESMAEVLLYGSSTTVWLDSDPRVRRAQELLLKGLLEGRESAEPKAFNGLLPRYR